MHFLYRIIIKNKCIIFYRKFIVMDLTKSGCYKAFPCFNKPDYKCWVSLTVIRKPNFYALSTASVNYTINV